MDDVDDAPENSKFQPGQIWLTRNGLKATITNVHTLMLKVIIHGAWGCDLPRWLDSEGRYGGYTGAHNWDLVTLLEEVK